MRIAIVCAAVCVVACDSDVPANLCEPIADAYAEAMNEPQACDIHAENPCVRYGYAGPGPCSCGEASVTATTAATLDDLRQQYAEVACEANTACLVGCAPPEPTACHYRRDGNHSCDADEEYCADALLDPVRTTFAAFYDGLANACDDVSDCVVENASVVRGQN
jgi:hypothetical protein